MVYYCRFESNLGSSAANAFKLNDFHALVIPKVHDVTQMTFNTYSEAFDIAKQWFQRVLEEDMVDGGSNARKKRQKVVHDFPVLTFDSMPHAGVSQIHPHFQIMAGN